MTIRVSKQSGLALAPKELESLLRRAVRVSLRRMVGDTDWEVSLVLTDDKGIQKLNRVHRGIDQPTDVLSFPQLPGKAGQEGTVQGKLLGDIIISVERAAAQAVDYGHSYEREMAFLTVHGMLHLLGMDHIEEGDRARMEAAQRQILLAMGKRR